MESSTIACAFEAQKFSSSVFLPRNGEISSTRCRGNYGLSLMMMRPKQQRKVAMNCGKEGSVSELAKNKKNGLDVDEIVTEEELMGFGRLREKCREMVNGGIAELLECLEREAIMGEDEGKEPSDYNRRAQIFDKSSRVFQALKQKSSSTNTNNTS